MLVTQSLLSCEKFTQDRASSTDLFQPDLKEALPRPPRPPVMSRALSPLCTTSARGTSSSAAPLALMTVPGGTYTSQSLVLISSATNQMWFSFQDQDQLAKQTESCFIRTTDPGCPCMCAGVAYMVQIALSVTLPTVISNLSELQPVPWIQVGNSKAYFPV